MLLHNIDPFSTRCPRSPILQGGEELGSPVSYLCLQIHLLMSIARVRPFDVVSMKSQPPLRLATFCVEASRALQEAVVDYLDAIRKTLSDLFWTCNLPES